MWIARDLCGNLWVFNRKPVKNIKDAVWEIQDIEQTDYFDIVDKRFFPEVKWEDEEPRELILKPINEK